jgi:hypothetical protein
MNQKPQKRMIGHAENTADECFMSRCGHGQYFSQTGHKAENDGFKPI